MKEASLLIATTNKGKVRELRGLLAELPLRLFSLLDVASVPEVEETADTFEGNAVLKAQAYSSFFNSWTLADDSGLEVEALGGRPGVYSARYAGPGLSYAKRMEKLLAELQDTGDRERRARFMCVVALAHPGRAQVHTFHGECQGSIALAPRGTGGFGYDPVFVPDGYTETFAELPNDTKQHLSHRGRAMAKAREFLRLFVGSLDREQGSV